MPMQLMSFWAAPATPSALIRLAMVAAGMITVAVPTQLRAQDIKVDAFSRCRSITDDMARLRCFEGAADAPHPQSPPAPSPPAAQAVGQWRLLRTPDPRGGADAVAIMRTADMAQSDLGFAGLMLRCGQGTIETVIVTTEPFPPRAQPKVKIVAGASEVRFDAKVVPPFSALLLPAEAIQLADGPWQSLARLSVEIDDGQNTIHGTIALMGLGPALTTLRTSCPAR
jgi:hypothetical protein